jgi:hypothetical protein
MGACCPVGMGRARLLRMVKYFAGGWTVQELAAIEQELERQGVRYTIDGDDLLLHDEHQERMVDMLVESITET